MNTITDAELKCLEYKLCCIRDIIECRLEVVDDITARELKHILDIISRYETVPSGWINSRPIVKEDLNVH